MPTALTPDYLIVGVIWYIAFLFSTVCHEGSHALVAKWGGDLTAFHGGQVSLNPIPHIRRAPFGLVVVPIISYALNGWMIGWASAPYDPEWSRRYPRRAAWMALAGPAANFTLMLLAGIAIQVGVATHHFQAPESPTLTHITELAGGGTNLLSTFISVMFMLNLLLGTFNLLPIPPLDGNVGITVFMNESTARRFTDWFRTNQFGFLGIVLAWYGFGYIFQPVFLFALNVLYPGSHYHPVQ
ncbi:MAG TPA: site-2 protease family protein [Candidatus Acidoferrum sp.]|nr:site-2 protease family protein [Candidatus Acidoferrum sp.]